MKRMKKTWHFSFLFGVFLHYTAVLNFVRATHGLPADRAPVYRGCPCRDPLGCPLIPRQDGIRDKAPTLWLLLWTETGMYWLRVRARATITELVGEGNFSHSLSHTLSQLTATSTRDLRRNHTCNRSPCQHNRRIYTHLSSQSLVISHTFPCSLLPSGNQKCNRNCHLCAHRQTHPPLDQGTVFVEPPLFLNCLDGWYSALYRHRHINNSVFEDTLWEMIWYTSTISTICSTVRCRMRSCGIRRTTSTISSMTGYTPSNSNQTTGLRSTLEEHSLSTYCTSTREPVLDKCCTISISTICSRGWSCIPALVSNCLHLRLIVWT